MPVLLDSSALYALIDAVDPAHNAVREGLAAEPGAIIVPQSALVETCYLVQTRLGDAVERAFLAGLLTSAWRIEALTDDDLRRAIEILDRYADARLGFVDASTCAIAERLGVRRIYTLDRPDFSLVRPRHVPAFEILPIPEVTLRGSN